MLIEEGHSPLQKIGKHETLLTIRVVGAFGEGPCSCSSRRRCFLCLKLLLRVWGSRRLDLLLRVWGSRRLDLLLLLNLLMLVWGSRRLDLQLLLLLDLLMLVWGSRRLDLQLLDLLMLVWGSRRLNLLLLLDLRAGVRCPVAFDFYNGREFLRADEDARVQIEDKGGVVGQGSVDVTDGLALDLCNPLNHCCDSPRVPDALVIDLGCSLKVEVWAVSLCHKSILWSGKLKVTESFSF